MVKCGFNTLVPAMVFKLRIWSLYPMGELPTGGLWSNGNGVGTLVSVPGFEPFLNATTVHMDDFNVRGSADGPYTLNAQGILRTDDNHYLGLYGKGLLANTPHVQAIMANETDVQPTRWGELDTFTTWTFQASGPYAELTKSTFVANIRIAPSDNSDTISYIDYRFSKVLPGPACEEGKDDVIETVWNAGEL
ncbi:hypothetical protein F5B22DRAFT_618719 [Xylaria bambusicola]|uniref:uncharacterized protein n=1 Tax=Xylaria bambusicola TaxID=326684 RepID=UPI002008BBFE|nr:uncharacterized protein F5B22DRAFT_618719 [Xylaria bambusicola]KAI0508963.1 hypothetical protein F5B22DRAFT_618719 [Xylaria bambusicola]